VRCEAADAIDFADIDQPGAGGSRCRHRHIPSRSAHALPRTNHQPAYARPVPSRDGLRERERRSARGPLRTGAAWPRWIFL
jgi:hypothetical protein